MKTRIWELITVGGWVLAVVLLIFSTNRPDVLSLNIAGFLFGVWSLYSIGNKAADEDRRAEVTDTDLSFWKRRILFLGQTNPFRRKTVIFQTTLVIGMVVLAVTWLIAPYTTVSIGVALVWMAGAVIMMPICNIRIWRDYKDTSTFFSVVRGYSKPKQIAVFVVIGVVIVVWVLMMIS